MLKLLLFFVLLLPSIAKNNHVDYLLEHSKRNYENISSKATSYNQAYKSALEEYKKSILELWPNLDISDNTKWVEYTNNYKYKKVIDYKKKLMYVQVISQDEKDASKAIIILFEDIYDYDTYKAFKNDILNKKINKKLSQAEDLPLENTKLISDVVSKKEQDEIISNVALQKYKKTNYKNNTIYTSKVKLPSDFTIRKAKIYSKLINKYAKKTNIDKNILFAIIHTESAFNPIARSHIPAFGLMQIVPKTAGIDSYKKLYGKKRLLSSRYLYKPENNIKIGSTYLNIVFFTYLKNIKDKKSRLYCTIAAYNTGVTNLARTFGRNVSRLEAIKLINKMSSSQLYKKLLKRLPAKQTRLYLSKVTRSINQYKHLNL